MGTGEASTDEKTSKNSAKQCKTAFLLASEPITVTEGRRGNVKMGMNFFFQMCPNDSRVHKNRAKLIISPTCFATF